jgi:hypothetical protein
MHGCRIISNFFIGSIVADRLQYERETNPYVFFLFFLLFLLASIFLRVINDNHTKLYQHSLECPIVLQMFLKCQPDYWCFVPMRTEQAIIDDANLTVTERDTLATYQTSNSTLIEQARSPYIRDAILVRWCVDHVPSCPRNYQFSLRQKIEQYEFFRDRMDLFPIRFLDLYNAAIVIACK